MGNLFYEQLEKQSEESKHNKKYCIINDKLIMPPEVNWEALEGGYNDEEFELKLDVFRKVTYPHMESSFIAYFRQRYDFEKEWEYLTVLITLHDNDTIYEWDFDEGQQHREWLYLLDINEGFENRERR